MSRGVAVAFKKRFGKPSTENLVNTHLTFQQYKAGAGVYGLITKPKFSNKPVVSEYNIAFQRFTEDFKEKGFKSLICSPMGCIRDGIQPEIFIANLLAFQKTTGSSVNIVVYKPKTIRKLQTGLTYEAFLERLKTLLKQDEYQPSSPVLIPESSPSKGSTAACNLSLVQSSPAEWHGWGSPVSSTQLTKSPEVNPPSQLLSVEAATESSPSVVCVKSPVSENGEKMSEVSEVSKCNESQSMQSENECLSNPNSCKPFFIRVISPGPT